MVKPIDAFPGLLIASDDYERVSRELRQRPTMIDYDSLHPNALQFHWMQRQEQRHPPKPAT